jgi:hypothetical protein
MVANSTSLVISSGLNLIDCTLGSNIGDLTEVGGLDSAFNGNYDQSSYACAVKSNADSGYIGKTLATSCIISKAITYASNNVGYASCDTLTLQLYAKQGSAPISEIDGTLLADSGEFADINGNTNPITLVSNDIITRWDHGWVIIIPSTNNVNLRIAQLDLYGNPILSTFISANMISTPAISANGELGTDGQVLTSNGSTNYWATPTPQTPQDFGTQVATANGYIDLPGGIIIQWGWIAANATVGNITFPTEFPTSIFSYQATSNSTIAANLVSIIAANTTTMNVRSLSVAAASNSYWLAIGI